MGLVDYKVQEDHLAIITLSRSEKKNAINEDMFHAMREAWERFNADENAWVAILTAEGDIFSSGADLSMVKMQMDPEFDFMGWYRGLVDADPYQSGRLTKPVIAAVNGDAYGGGLNLILLADMVVCADDTKFRMPEPDFGGIVIFWQNVPRAFSMELNTGFFVSAKRFYDVGVFNKLVPREDVMEEAKKMAYKLLAKPPLSIRKTTEILHDFYEKAKPMENELMRKKVSESSEALKFTSDKKEAVKAFSEKRKANFECK